VGVPEVAGLFGTAPAGDTNPGLPAAIGLAEGMVGVTAGGDKTVGAVGVTLPVEGVVGVVAGVDTDAGADAGVTPDTTVVMDGANPGHLPQVICTCKVYSAQALCHNSSSSSSNIAWHIPDSNREAPQVLHL